LKLNVGTSSSTIVSVVGAALFGPSVGTKSGLVMSCGFDSVRLSVSSPSKNQCSCSLG
jgi:hypothetical protein